MTVQVIAGPPCAGKTTLARAQSGNVIDLDDIEEELGGERYALRSDVRTEALRIRQERIDTALRSNEDTWVIHSAPTPEQVSTYLAAGATLRVIDPGEDTCIERASDRPPHTAAVIRDWYQNFPLHSGLPISTRPEPHGNGLPEQGEPMSDTAPAAEQTATEPNGDAANTATQTPEIDYKAKYEEALGHSRTWEDRAKANKKAADELEQLKEAQKTAEQKQAEEVETLKRENAQFKLERQQAEWASAVSAETGVPASVLRGSTLEELTAHAEALKPAFEKPTPEPVAEPPAVVPTIGQSPASGNVPLPDQIAAAEAAGDRATASVLKAMQLGTPN